MSAASMTKALAMWCKSLKQENDFNKRYTRSKYKFNSSPRFRVGGKMKSE
jgi:hypothetical protein